MRVTQSLPGIFFRSNGNPSRLRILAASRPASNRTWFHTEKPQTVSYPFAFERLRLRLCALFFRCLLAILFSECLVPDCECPDAGPCAFAPSVFSCCTSAIQFLLVVNLIVPVCPEACQKKPGHAQVCSPAFEELRLPARSWSEEKAFPHVLHLLVTFDFTSFPVSGANRPTSLGRKAITSSPPHSRHWRIPMFTLLSQVGVCYLITIAHRLACRRKRPAS